MAKTIAERLDQTREIRDSLLDILEKRASKDYNSYSVNDKSISKMSLSEIQAAYTQMNGEVRRLKKEFNRRNGRSSATRFKF